MLIMLMIAIILIFVCYLYILLCYRNLAKYLIFLNTILNRCTYYYYYCYYFFILMIYIIDIFISLAQVSMPLNTHTPIFIQYRSKFDHFFHYFLFYHTAIIKFQLISNNFQSHSNTTLTST